MNETIIRQLGLTPDDLRSKFVYDTKSRRLKADEKVNRLINITRDRIREGRRQNLVDFRMWWALDCAYDVPHKQTTYSHVSTFIERVMKPDMQTKDVLKLAKEWGVTSFLQESENNGKKCYTVSLPVFYQIWIPLVRAYLHIRWAKLYNDRNVFPLLKFEPLKNTEQNRLRCEIITDIVEEIGQQLGYRSTLRQWIFNALHYGTSLMFPIEDWYREKGLRTGGSDEPEVFIKKQGIRYAIPHPSRVFYDQFHRVGTFNSDAGCTFAGYWHIQKYREIQDNPAYWNTEWVTMMDHDLIRNNAAFFSTVYPCTMEFPAYSSGARSGAGDLDRESHASYYTSAHEDKGAVVCNIFQKINPVTYGLTSNEKADVPMWFRMVVANDNDVVYMAPLCYSPVLYMGYDAHEERRRNASLSLEIIPFQDHLSNLISQQILTAKQNLRSVIFVDEQVVPKPYLNELMNIGEDMYRKTIFIPHKGRKTLMAQNELRRAFENVPFPVTSTAEQMQTFRLLLDTLERVLVFSAQEVGSVASHEQTAEETRIVQGSVNNRVALTDSFVDDGVYAWKRQQYDGFMGYGDENIDTQVDVLPPITAQVIDAMGFEIIKGGAGMPGVTKAQLKGKKKKLEMEGFVSAREGENRINNPELASGMAHIMQVMMGNELTALAIGPRQAIEVFNTIIRLAGLPRDFKLNVENQELIDKMMGKGQEAQGEGQPVTQEEVVKAFETLSSEIEKRTTQQTQEIVQQAAAPIMEAVERNTGDISDLQKVAEQFVSRLSQLAMAASQGESRTAPVTK